MEPELADVSEAYVVAAAVVAFVVSRLSGVES
jgi:hypothetical protein